jgi:hypothetical protein
VGSWYVVGVDNGCGELGVKGVDNGCGELVGVDNGRGELVCEWVWGTGGTMGVI